MEKEELEKLRQIWYSHSNIKFELVRFLKDREFVTIHTEEDFKTLRCLKANAIKYLDIIFDIYKILTKPYNFYGSLARFKDYPNFSYNNKLKKVQQQNFNMDFEKKIYEFDLLIDIDNKDIMKAYDSAKKVKEIFDLYKFPYSLKASGNKGFHFEVEFETFPEELKKMSFSDISIMLKTFAENFRAINEIKDIDLTVFDLRRVNKAPYSVVLPTYNIALPLTDTQFENFTPELIHISNCIKDLPTYYKRGRLFRDGIKEGFAEMFDDYISINISELNDEDSLSKEKSLNIN